MAYTNSCISAKTSGTGIWHWQLANLKFYAFCYNVAAITVCCLKACQTCHSLDSSVGIIGKVR